MVGTYKYFSWLVLLLAGITLNAQDYTTTTDDVSCTVGEGRIIVEVTAGTAPYSYFLYDGDPFGGGSQIDQELNTLVDTHVFAGLTAGDYWIRLLATEGNKINPPTTLATVQDSALSVTKRVVSGPTCINSSDAILEATGHGANGGYTYLWDAGAGSQTTAQASGLSQGVYRVSVSDYYGCGPVTATFFYRKDWPDDGGTIPDSLDPGSITGSQTICSGGNPAIINEGDAPVGGSGGYTYTWHYQTDCAGAWNLIGAASDPTYDPPGPLNETRCYRRTVTNTCGVMVSDNIPSVTVEPLPIQYNVTLGTTPICEDGNTTVDLSDTEADVTYELYLDGAPTGNTIAGTGNPISWIVSTDGTYTVEGVKNGGERCSQLMTGNPALTVELQPIEYSIGTSTVTICQGDNTVINQNDSELGVTYQLYLDAAPTGTFQAGTGNPLAWTVSAEGTYTVEGVNDGGLNCNRFMDGSVDVTIELLPTQYAVTLAQDPICAGDNTTVDLSDSQLGVTYELYEDGAPTGNTQPGTGNPLNWTVTAEATYTVEGVNDGGINCSQFMTGNPALTHEALPNLYIVSIDDNTICSGLNTSVRLSDSDIGVNYELYRNGSGTGDIIAGDGNPLAWTVNTAGTYTVEAENSGGINCTQTMNGSEILTVENLPTQYLVTLDSDPICSGDNTNVRLSDSQLGVTYELYRNGAPTANFEPGTGNTITWSVNQAGTYTVEGVNDAGDNCSQFMTGNPTLNVEARPAQYNVTIDDNAICSDVTTSVRLSDSDLGVNYELYRNGSGTGDIIAGDGNPLAWTVNTAGTYTVEAENGGGINCTQTMNGSEVLTVETIPALYNVTLDNDPICSGDNTNVRLSDSQLGVTYELYRNGAPTASFVPGTGNPITWSVNQAGTYTVEAVNDAGLNCSQFMTGNPTLNVEARPAQYNVTIDDNAICSDVTTSVRLSDSDLGVNYELYRNGSGTGDIIAGDGNPLAWTVNTAGTYTVEAENGGGINCTQTMNGSEVLTVETIPTLYTVTLDNDPICSGDNTNVRLSDSQLGVTYELYRNAVPTASFVPGTGNQITWSVNQAGTYTVEAVNDAGLNCSRTMNGNPTLNVEARPAQYNVTIDDNAICSDVTTSVRLSDSDLGVNYELYRNGSGTGDIIAGDGNPLAWTVNTAGTYTVEAENGGGINCTQTMNGSEVLTVETIPTLYTVTLDNDPICSGDNTNVRLSDSQLGVTYELYRNAVPTASFVPGTGNQITWSVNQAGTYTVEAVNDAGLNCSRTMNGNPTLNVEARPTQYNVTIDDNAICSDVTTSVRLSDSDLGVNYELYRNGSGTGDIIAGDGNPLAWTVNTAGTYTVEAENSGGINCTQTMNGSEVLTVETIPSLYNVTLADNPICTGDNTTIDLSGSASGVTYELYLNAAPTGITRNGNGAALSWTVSAAGIYTVEAVNDAGLNCSRTMNGNPNLTLEALPAQYLVSIDANTICDGSTTNVRLSDSDNGVNYELYRNGSGTGDINPGDGNPLSWTVSQDGTYTVEAANAGGNNCTRMMTGSEILAVELLPSQYDVTIDDNSICAGDNTTVRLSDSDIGVTYELILNGVPTGTTRNGDGNPQSWTVSSAGTYSVEAENNGGLNCTETMNGSPVLSLEALPTQYNVTIDNNTICDGNTTQVRTDDSDVSINYELYLDGAPTGVIRSGNGSALNWPVSTAGTYTVEGVSTTANACSQFMNNSPALSVELLPSVYNVTILTGTICDGNSTTVTLSDSDIGVDYELYLDGNPTGDIQAGTGNPLNWTVTTAGIYTVEATNQGGENCTETMNGNPTLNVESLPTIYNVTGTNTICAGESTSISLDDSQGGVSYELYLNLLPTGNIRLGNGQPRTWDVSAAGDYTVVATNSSGINCTQNMNGTATVTVEALPSIYNVSLGTAAICDGTNTTLDLSDSDIGVKYELYRNNIAQVDTIDGTGNPISWTVNTAGTYTVEAINNGGERCNQFMNGNPSLTVELLPNQFNVTINDATICDGSGTNVILSSSQNTVNYELYRDLAPTGDIIAGDGDSITWAVTAAGSYTVEATNIGGINCSASMNGNPSLALELLPTVYNVSTAVNDICNGDSTDIDLSGSQLSVTYELYRNGSGTGRTIAGDGTPISWKVGQAGTYTIEAENDAGIRCTQTMNGSEIITVEPLPTLYTVSGTTTICNGLTTPIDLSDSESGVTYELVRNTIPTGNTIGGTGNPISWNVTLDGTYTVEAMNDGGLNCTLEMSGNAIVTVVPVPTVDLLPKTPSVCQNSDQVFNGNPLGGTLPYSHSWTGDGSTYLDDDTLQAPTFNSNTDGTFNLTYTVTDDNGCTDSESTTVTVIAEPVVNAGTDATICNDSSYAITGAIANNVLDYSWRSSSLTGSFNDPDIINPIYTPSAEDRTAGSVTIYLDGVANAPCADLTSSFELTIAPPVQPAIGTPAPFLIGVNTEIEVCAVTNTHFTPIDLGLYLVAPDGNTTVTLKEGPMIYGDFFFPPCFPVGDYDTVCFTTELALADTVDICTEPTPINGSFAATGDWSLLYGMNPAEGGWSIMVFDTATNMLGTDGALTFASISFIDTAITTGDVYPVDYNSGTINVSIIEEVRNSYIVPRGLRVSCPGECDAEAIVNVIGGTAPYNNYTWSPAPFATNPLGDNVSLCVGTYNLTVEDAMGCVGTTSVDVISPPVINIDKVNYTDTISCFGDSTGFISVTASGGTGSLSYTLLPGNIPSEEADSGYFSGLPIGSYTVHIEDSRGCSRDTAFTIYQRTQLVLATAAVTDTVYCVGDNGEIQATASGGTEPYTFILEEIPGTVSTNNTGTFGSLGPGSYRVSLTDANGCDSIIWTDTLILGVPVPLTIDTVLSEPILCNGDSAQIGIVVSGGNPDYSLIINGGAGIPFTDTYIGTPDTIFVNLPANNYDFDVEDSRGCIDSWTTINHTEPLSITITNLAITDIPMDRCYTDPLGSIVVTAAGGTGTLLYSTNGSSYQSSNNLIGLTGGPKTVYVRDDNMCVIDSLTSVGGPPLLEGNPLIDSVDGSTPGSITLNPIGGTPFPLPDEYRYRFDGSAVFDLNNILSVPDSGNYYAAVQDFNGCIWQDSVYVPRLFLDVTDSVVHSLCFAKNQGEIILSVHNGQQPYDYYIEGLPYTGFPNTLHTFPYYPGKYHIRVVDDNGRDYQDTITIESPPEITFAKDSTHNACSEYSAADSLPGASGMIRYQSSGGVGGFTYDWADDTAEEDSVRTGLVAGTYYVTITDTNNCTVIDTTELIDLTTISASLGIAAIETNGTMDGSTINANDTVCFGSSWELRGLYSMDIDDATESWSPTGLEIIDDHTRSVTITQPVAIRYQVNYNGCMDYDVVTLNVFDTLGMMINTSYYRVLDTVFNQINTPLTLSATSGFSEYLWTTNEDDNFEPSNAANTSIITRIRQTISVIGTTPYGCYESDTIYLIIRRPIGEPFEVFTPNGDGYNDKWIIPNAEQWTLEVTIFNRWGQQVFYSSAYGSDDSNTWDGRSQKNGKDLPIGSYYYIIKNNDDNKEPISGTVTIVR